MNRFFRLVRSAATGAVVAVGELARGRGKASGRSAGVLATGALGMLAIACGNPGQAQAQAHAPAQVPAATALPSGGQVVSGTATFQQVGAQLTVQQASDKLITNWQSFDIGAGATVRFNQPGAASVALNRVLSNDPSAIYGTLQSNGQVFLVNPSGVLFGASARVDVGGLVASSLQLTDADFLAGRYRFGGPATSGAVGNQGRISAAAGGYLAFIAPRVSNTGSLNAPQGSVALGAGEQVSLDFAGDKLLRFSVDQGTVAALVDNQGLIEASGGSVLLSARAADAVTRAVVNQGGVVDASSLVAKGGRIVLEGDEITLKAGSRTDASGTTGGGAVLVGGDWQGSGPMRQATTVTMDASASIDASATHNGDGGTVVLWSDLRNAESLTTAPGSVLARGGVQGGNGGRVETSASTVDIAGFRVDTLAPQGQAGLWLIDPFDYNINAAQASAISTALNTSSVTVTTVNDNVSQGSNGNNSSAGDINVNSSITKTSGGTTILTLEAARHIRLRTDATITSTNGALNVSLQADTNNDGDGIVFIEGAGISTNGGSLTFGGNGRAANIGGSMVRVGGDVFFQRESAQTLNTNGGAVNVWGETIVSNTAGLSVNSGGGSVSFYGLVNSGNAYNFVDRTSGGSWDAARTDARSGTFGSAVNDSYLVTIGSRLENSIAGLTAGYKGAWIGAWRSNSNSYAWSWADGPQAGQVFFTQSGSGGSGGGSVAAGFYANFGSGEPNGNLNITPSNTETVGQFFGSAGSWNDLNHTTAYSTDLTNQYAVTGFVRETNLAASPVTINASTGNVTFTAGVGGSKALASLTVTSSGINIEGIQVNGLIDIRNSGAGLITGGIFGAGASLLKSGAGTLTLSSGANTYTGTTTINAGTLNVTGSLSNSTAVTVASGATYALGASDTIGSLAGAGNVTLGNFTSTLGNDNTSTTFSGVMSGIGALVKQGTGTFILSGANTYTGATTISTGVVTVGNGATTGTLGGGAVTLNGTLSFNRSDTFTVANAISGSGELTKTGAGTLILTGANNYSGLTRIIAGTLQIGDGGTTGTLGTNQVTNDSALAFNRSNDLTVSNTIIGTGSLNKSGSGTLTLTANNTYSGANTIAGGTLVLSNNAPNPTNKSFNGTGQLRIEPTATSFSSGFSTSGWIFSNTLTGLTLGKVGNTSGITLGSATSIGGPISIFGGNIAVNFALTATAGNILLDADNGIQQSYSGRGVNIAAAVTTTDGNITIEGRGGNSSGDQDGVFVNNVAVTAGGTGTVSVTGRGGASSIGGNHGVRVSGDGGLITSINGNVTVTGTGGGAGAAGVNIGVLATVGGSMRAGGSSALAVTGTGGSATGVSQWGIRLDRGVIASAGGAITLTGVGGGLTGSSDNDGIRIGDAAGSTVGSAASGNIAVNGTAGIGSGSEGISLETNTVLGAAGYAGNVTLNANSLAVAATTVTSTGALTVQSIGTSFSSTFNTLGLTLSSGLTGLTLGKVGNTADITIGSATSIAGPINVFGRNLAITAGLATTGANTITLQSTGTVTQTAALTASSLALLGSGSFTLTNASNNIATLAASGIGGLSYDNSNALTLGTVGATNGISATGVVSIGTTTGDLTVAQNVSTTTATASALVLNAGSGAAAGTATGGNIVISGSAAISTGSNGRATLYSGSISGSTGLTGLVGSGTGRFRYNSDEVVAGFNTSTAALGTGLFAIYRERPTVTVAVDNQNAVYGSTPTWAFTLGNGQNGDTMGQAFATVPTVTVGGGLSTGGRTVVGSHTLTAAGGSSTSQLGYGFAGGYTPGTLTVTPRLLTVTYAGVNKVYDGNASATVGTSDDRLTSDLLTINHSANFASQNAANGMAVAVTGASLSGTDAANYSIAVTNGSTTASITPKALVIDNGTVVANKVYDGSTLASVIATGMVSGFIGTETLGVTPSANFTSAEAGNSNKSATVVYTLANGSNGGLAANYSLANEAKTGLSISPKALNLTGLVVANKTYDRSTTGSVNSFGSLSGTVGSDVVTLNSSSGAAAFADWNVGNWLVTVSGLTLSGAAAGNYSIANQTSTANILPRVLTISGITASNKVYDASTTATVNIGSAVFGGLMAGDSADVTITAASGSFDTKNVGNGKTVTLSTTVGGSAQGNYIVTNQASATASITPATLTATGNSATGIYTGLAQTVNGFTLSGLQGSDTAASLSTIVASGATRTNAGTATNIVTAGIETNYTISTVDGTLTIDKANATVTANSDTSLVYNGAVQSVSGFTATGLVNGETVAVLSGVTAGASATNAGSYASTASGSDNNYNLTFVNGSLVIAKAALTATGNSATGIYTGLAQSVNGFTLSGLQGTDTVASLTTVVASGATRTNAGTATNSVTAGTEANYTISTVDGTLTIDKANATVTANSDTSLVYNGAVQSVSGFTATGLVNGETVAVLSGVTAGASASNAGIYASTASGTNNNYNLTFLDGSLVIARAALTATVTAPSKVYDGHTDAAPVLRITAGLVGNETLVVTGTGSFNSKDVLTANTVTITSASLADGGNGGLASNYSLVTGQTAAASITPRQVTLAGSAGLVKIYDGNVALPSGGLGYGSLSGLLGSDRVSVIGAPVFDRANAGSRNVLQGTVRLTGDASLNYSLAWTPGSGSITPRNLIVSGITVANKVYDGSTAASVNASNAVLAGLVAGDVVTISASGRFVDKNVGQGKTVTLISGYAGDDVSNYRIVSQDSTTANITRLAQVTWTGGDGGNWFDPANWAGGAVPDLANVSQVLIPAGVTVTFGDTALPPAESGTVQIDLLGVLGSLNVTGGTLNVGSGGVELLRLVQSGGTLSSASDLRLGTLAQTGGSTSVQGAMNVTEDFEQSGNGSLSVRGSVNITDTRGGSLLGNLSSGGPLTVRSLDGDIRQTPASMMAQGSASFSARTASGLPADVVLAEATNDFAGRVDVSARNAELTDRNGLALGRFDVSGELRLISTGDLNLGQGEVGGRLLARSNGGNVMQTGALVVSNGTDIAAGSGAIALGRSDNRLTGQLRLATDGGVNVLSVTSVAAAAATNAATQTFAPAAATREGANASGSALGGMSGAAAQTGADRPLSVSMGVIPVAGELQGQIRFSLVDSAGNDVAYEAELVGTTLRIKARSSSAAADASSSTRDRVIEAALQALQTQLLLPRSRVSVAYLAM